jgi:hypothetical protein
MVKITVHEDVILETLDDDTIQLRCRPCPPPAPTPVVTPTPPAPLPTPLTPSLGTIAIVNLSTTDKDSVVQTWVNAIQKQLSNDVAKFYGCTSTLVFLPGATPTTAIPKADGYFGIMDNADVAGAYGWHDTGPNNEPVGKAFTKDAEANGVTVSSIVSHEMCECIGDWNAATIVKGFDETGKPCEYYRENCDPVEALSYKIDGIEVSDFITPFWFLDKSTKQLDFMNAVQKPFQILPGGYMEINYGDANGWTQVNRDSKLASMHKTEHSRYALYKKPLDARVKSTFKVQ